MVVPLELHVASPTHQRLTNNSPTTHQQLTNLPRSDNLAVLDVIRSRRPNPKRILHMRSLLVDRTCSWSLLRAPLSFEWWKMIWVDIGPACNCQPSRHSCSKWARAPASSFPPPHLHICTKLVFLSGQEMIGRTKHV